MQIGDHQVECRARAQQFQRFATVGATRGLIAVRFDDMGLQFARGERVVHHQYTAFALRFAWCEGLARVRGLRGVHRRARQRHVVQNDQHASE